MSAPTITVTCDCGKAKPTVPAATAQLLVDAAGLLLVFMCPACLSGVRRPTNGDVECALAGGVPVSQAARELLGQFHGPTLLGMVPVRPERVYRHGPLSRLVRSLGRGRP